MAKNLGFSYALVWWFDSITSKTIASEMSPCLYSTFDPENKNLLCLCCCRIWIRTRGRCCPSSMAFTASSAAASLSAWWWWTTCCRAPWRCTTSTTWRVPRTNVVPHAKSVSSPPPRSKTWTSRRCTMVYTSMLTPTTPWWRPCSETVGYVYKKTSAVGHDVGNLGNRMTGLT